MSRVMHHGNGPMHVKSAVQSISVLFKYPYSVSTGTHRDEKQTMDIRNGTEIDHMYQEPVSVVKQRM